MSKGIDTGDHVLHRPTGEKWVVAFVEGDVLFWCGWPEGCAALTDCELVRKASPEQRRALLIDMQGTQGLRGAYARRALADGTPA